MALSGAVAALAVVQVSLAQTGGTVPSTPVPLGAATQIVDQSSQARAPRQLTGTPWTLRFGPQRPDLVRYNRVEGLSFGARGQLRPSTPLGPLSLTATARLGMADVHLNGRLDIAHVGLDRRWVVSGYHELAELDERARYLGPVNSLTALLYGRDDGDYYRRSGAMVELTPPQARPRTFRVRVFTEYHEAAAKETDVQLPHLWDDGRTFRPNILAEEGWEYGGSLEVSPRFGNDPTRTRGGLEAFVQGATGDFEYVRARLGGDVDLAFPGHARLTLEAETGSSWGSPSVQRAWYLGGPLTLRGYAPRTLGGGRFWRGRVEVGRRFSFGRVALFSDAGWAGDSKLELDGALYSVGAGLAIIDAILRIDGAWQLDSPRDFRLDIYLDRIL